MAGALAATGPAARASARMLFARQVQANAVYWRERLQREAGNLAALDTENENLARAVWLGLGSDDTRPAAFELIGAAREFVLRRGNSAAWGDLLNSAAHLAADAAPTRSSIMVLITTAQVYERRFPGPEAGRLYRTALRLSRRLPEHPDLRAWVLADLGRLLFYRGMYARGSVCVRQARELAERQGNRQVLARAMLGLGQGHNCRREWQAALDCLSQALCLAEELQDANCTGCTHYEFGVAYWHAGEWQRARAHVEQALAWLQRSGDISLQSLALTLLGVLCFEMNEFGPALEHFLLVEADLKRRGNDERLASLHNNLGAACWGLRRWEEAEYYFALARAEYRFQGDRLHAAEAAGNLADCYLDQHQWPAAAAALTDAHTDLAAIEPPTARTRLLARLAELEARLAASQSQVRPSAGHTPG